jgi:hypothetical protein
VKTSKIGLATFVVLLVAGITSILVFSRGLHVNGEAVHHALFDPYGAALHANEWERAWQTFTTDSYRARHPLAAYRAAYDDRARAHGGVTSITCPHLGGVRRGSQEVLIAATCRVRFGDSTETSVRFSVVGIGTHLAIDGANGGSSEVW